MHATTRHGSPGAALGLVAAVLLIGPGCARDFDLPGASSSQPRLTHVEPAAGYAGQTLRVEGTGIAPEVDPWLLFVGGKSRITFDAEGRAEALVPPDIQDGPLGVMTREGVGPPFFFDEAGEQGFDYLGFGTLRRGILARRAASSLKPRRLVATPSALYLHSEVAGGVLWAPLEGRAPGYDFGLPCGGGATVAAADGEVYIVRPEALTHAGSCDAGDPAPAGYVMVDAAAVGPDLLVLAKEDDTRGRGEDSMTSYAFFSFDPDLGTFQPRSGSILGSRVEEFMALEAAGRLYALARIASDDLKDEATCAVQLSSWEDPGDPPVSECISPSDCDPRDGGPCPPPPDMVTTVTLARDPRAGGEVFVILGTTEGTLHAIPAGNHSAMRSTATGVDTPIGSLQVLEDAGGSALQVVATLPDQGLVVGMDFDPDAMPGWSFRWSQVSGTQPTLLSNPVASGLGTSLWVADAHTRLVTEILPSEGGRTRRVAALSVRLGTDTLLLPTAMATVRSQGQLWVATVEQTYGGIAFFDPRDPQVSQTWVDTSSPGEELAALWSHPTLENALYALRSDGLWLGHFEIDPYDVALVSAEVVSPPPEGPASDPEPIAAVIDESGWVAVAWAPTPDSLRLVRREGPSPIDLSLPQRPPEQTSSKKRHPIDDLVLVAGDRSHLVVVLAPEKASEMDVAIVPAGADSAAFTTVACPEGATCGAVAGGAFVDGRLYLAFGMDDDEDPWSGLLMAVDLDTGAREVWRANLPRETYLAGSTPGGQHLVWTDTRWVGLLERPRTSDGLARLSFGVDLGDLVTGITFHPSGERAYLSLRGQHGFAVIE